MTRTILEASHEVVDIWAGQKFISLSPSEYVIGLHIPTLLHPIWPCHFLQLMTCKWKWHVSLLGWAFTCLCTTLQSSFFPLPHAWQYSRDWLFQMVRTTVMSGGPPAVSWLDRYWNKRHIFVDSLVKIKGESIYSVQESLDCAAATNNPKP